MKKLTLLFIVAIVAMVLCLPLLAAGNTQRGVSRSRRSEGQGLSGKNGAG